MGDDEKRRLRDEVAELSKAVRDLREQLAKRDGHVCCPGICCGCGHPHAWTWPYYVPTYVPPVPAYPQITWTCGNTTAAPPPNTTITYDTNTTAIPGAVSFS